jgi:hypothetical protein
MVEASDWLHCPFDSSTLPSEKTVRMRQQSKAVGCVPPTALLSPGGSAIWVAKKTPRAEQPSGNVVGASAGRSPPAPHPQSPGVEPRLL